MKTLEAPLHIAYAIKTKNGWTPLAVTINVPRETMRNPFRSYQAAGYPSFKAWLRSSG